MVVPGHESVKEVRPSVALARRLIDTARGFFERGAFASVLELLPDPTHFSAALWPAECVEAAAAVRPLARFYAAWDRLDYRAAAAIELPRESDLPAAWRAFGPPPEVRRWVAGLGESLPETNRDKGGAMAARLRLIAADLLANGERRIRDHQFEDALLRAYRIYELVGQARLFDRGYDSERIPADDPVVKKTQERLQKKGSEQFGKRADGTLTAARFVATKLLTELGDPLGERLRKEADDELTSARSRNRSILVHGFTAAGPDDDGPLRRLYARLESLLLDDGGEDVRPRIETARFLDFSRGRTRP
jgi:hypothetical protein